jgi:hypothetical protein
MAQEVAENFLTLAELAKFVGVSYQRIRELFGEGLLPEPKHRIKFKEKTTRRFTRQEAQQLKVLFDNPAYYKWKERRKRARNRQRMRKE